MTDFVIEKNIPMPLGRRKGLPAALRAMEVGDSIFVTVPYGSVCGSTNTVAKELGFTFTRRVVEGGYRIWRSA